MKQAALACAIAVALCSPATSATAQAGDDWTVDLTVYGWLTGVEGGIRAPALGLGANAALSPRDVLDNLEGALFGKLEFWGPAFGLTYRF